MAERTVKVNLTADVSDYTASLARAAAQTRGLSDSVETEFKKTEVKSRQSGERSGGLFARGLNQGLIRNSPLIVAGVGGALAAGAPAAIAGATTLFAGIGAVAAAQSVQVRRSWLALGQSIRDGAVEDAAVLVPVFSRVADQLSESFSALRPQLRDAFAAVAPQVETFANALDNAARVAMPALVRAVQAGAPVTDGLARAVEAIGQGIADFMDAVSVHGDAAGTALAAIGQIVGSLLPILGELLGTGTELASVVLPPLASVLGVVADALHLLEPILPAVAAGLVALKVSQTLTGPMATLAQNLAFASYNGGAFATAAGKASTAVSSASSAVPLLGAVIGGVATLMQRASEQGDQWAAAIREGGDAADEARAQMSDFGTAMETSNSGFAGFLSGLAGVGTQVGVAAIAIDDANQKIDKQQASMSNLELAQQAAREAQSKLTDAVDKYGVSSPQATVAANAYRQAQADVAFQSSLTEGAIDGVTQAMIDQYNQAIAATNSSYAYRQAQDTVQGAEETLAAAVRDHGAASEEATDAGLALEQALLQQAVAAGQLASDALPASAGELEHNTAAAQGTLAELYRLRDQMGSAFPASLQTTIANLEATGVHVDKTSGQFVNLGDTVNSVPTFHNIKVDADLGPAEAKLNAFIQRHWTAIISSNVEGSGGGGSGGSSRGAVHIATGGYVSGPGTGTSDSIPAMISNGEFVVNAAATARNRGLLETINAQRFANGGYVGKDWTKILYDADLSGAEAGMTAARKAAGAALMAVSLAGVQTTGPVQDIVRSVASRFGWGSGAEWNALAWLIQHESGWRPTAQNPTSTAYGLFQFLNSTWGSVGGHKTSDPALQSQYGLTYIRNRYGDPLGAQRFWQAHHWYANGGVINEPVAGLGLSSGDRYMFGERGPEMVTPVGLSGSVSSGAAAPVVIDVRGAEVAGRIEVGADGLMRFVDGRIVSLATTATQSTQYSAAR